MEKFKSIKSENKQLKAGVSLLLLFALYHAAEYMILFRESAPGFLLFQALFFLVAWLLGNWYAGNGLAAWGLSGGRSVFRELLIGIGLGVFLYGVPFLLSLALGLERIVAVPDATTIFLATLPFAFGVIFSSFSEDILTRGLPYAHSGGKMKPIALAVLSAFVYLFNHIYRLGDGPEAWLYLFLLGIVFMIPVLITRRLWVTGAMHWAGNTFFFVTHSAIQISEGNTTISYNYFFALCLVGMIPVVLWGSRRLFAAGKS